MTETKPHQFEKEVVKAAGNNEYVEGQRVKIGQVLHITHLAGKFDNCATSEYVVLGYYDGHGYKEIYKGAPTVASDFVHWNGHIWLREGQYVYAYFADVATGERMTLRADGEYA